MKFSKRVAKLLKELTLEEKAALCYGCSGMSAGRVERLGIPELFVADGPQGLRFEDGRKATMLPSGVALAATFDKGMAKRFGALTGRECNANGVQCSLGPAFNLMRTPLCGRNFEYYGEDPVLAGEIASGYVEGCQCEGVATTPKHLALNNQEICRTTASSNLSERTLRELYLRAFEIVTKKAHPWGMMSSYNLINGTYASACKLTQQDIVKDEWGFDGVMMSDWGGAHDAVGCAEGGLDLEMGGANPVFKQLPDLVKSGKIPESLVEEKAGRVLTMLERTFCFEPSKRSAGEANTRRHKNEARKIAEAGSVLLKNRDGILPLDLAKYPKIAIVGPNADFRHSEGGLEFCGGSGAVYPPHETTPLEGMKRAWGRKCRIVYAPGVRFERAWTIEEDMLSTPDGKKGLRFEFFHDLDEMVGGKVAPFAVQPAAPLKFCSFGNVPAAGLAKRGALAAQLNEVKFCARLTGRITPENSGSVVFGLKAAQFNIKIYLDDRLCLQNRPGPDKCTSCKFSVKAGKAIEFVAEIERRNTDFSDMQLIWMQDEKALFDAAVEAVKDADLAIYVGGRSHMEDTENFGWGNTQRADVPSYSLPDKQDAFLKAICATKTPVVGVFCGGSSFDVEPWIGKLAAMLDVFYAGMEAGGAIAAMLSGKSYPGGKLPLSWAKKLTDYPCHGNGTYPGELDCPKKHVDYTEGIFIGYRALEKNGVAPRFPFGFGLSYGDFHCKLLECKVKKSDLAKKLVRVEATVEVANIGSRKGSEVVQLYVGDVESSVPRPVKELEAFAKIELAPNRKKTVKLALDWRDFAFWSEEKKAFTVEPGEFQLSFGTSSTGIFATANLNL